MSIPYLIGLFVLGTLAIAAEGVMPGGILGVMGGVLLAVIVGSAFINQGLTAGFAFLFAAVIASFLALLLSVYVLQETSLGSWMILESPSSDDSEGQPYEFLLGEQGTARSDLSPGGRVEIDGELYNTVTQGEYVESGTTVEVIEVEGNRIVVEEPFESEESQSEKGGETA
ncbi:MAG: NfeD family protein [bacterium]